MNEKKRRKQFIIYPQRPELMDQLRGLAQKNHRSMNGEINYALEKYINEQETDQSHGN